MKKSIFLLCILPFLLTGCETIAPLGKLVNDISALGLFGIIVSLAGFILVLAGIRVIVINVQRIAVTPGRKTWGLGIICILFGVVFLWLDAQAKPPVPPTPAPILTPIMTSQTSECPSIAYPSKTIQCPTTGNCIVEVRGCFPNVSTNFQTVVIFVDPGGGNWWPQNLDFPATLSDAGQWKGEAQFGIGYQPIGTEFHIRVFLMSKTEASKLEKKVYKVQELPPSDDSFGPSLLTVGK
jgi:hypothetical protein